MRSMMYTTREGSVVRACLCARARVVGVVARTGERDDDVR